MSFTCRSSAPPPASRCYLNTSTITFNPVGRSPNPLTLTPAGQLLIPSTNTTSIPTDINTQIKTLVDQALDTAIAKHTGDIDQKIAKIQESTDKKLQAITTKIEKNNTKLTADIKTLNESHNTLKTSIEAKLDKHSENFDKILLAIESIKSSKENQSPPRKKQDTKQETPSSMQH
jgi:hypothetical protein